jgi:hypothetical protein
MRVAKLRTSAFQSDLDELREAIGTLYDGALSVSGDRLIVDSSKDPVYAFLLATVADFDLHVVHLIRDSRAVAHSWARRVVRPEVTDRIAYMGRFGPAATAQRWNVKNALAELLKNQSASYTRIRYEDLVVNPVSSISHILGCIGESGVKVSAFAKGKHDLKAPPFYHTVAGNPIRFEQGALPIRLDDAWRTQLPRSSRRVVTSLTLPLLIRYGYFSTT